MLVRQRVESDLDACEQLARRVHRADGYPPRRADDLRGFVTSAGAIGAWVADIDGTIVGHVALNQTSSPEVVELAHGSMGCTADELAVVARLLVEPSARRLGVGAALLEAAADAARRRGRRPILDVASHLGAANGLYESSGWTRIGTVIVHLPGDDPLEEIVYCAPHPTPTLGGVQAEWPAFRMGRLDHVHIRVPDRAEAARWYSEHLGFEPVAAYDFWASGFDGGPLQISADGGRTTLALFEATEGHPMVPQQNGVAFSVDADTFMSFARSLPCGIDNPLGEPLTVGDLVDFDMCWAFDLADPWGNQYELNCYEHDRVRTELVEADAVEAVRKWPRELYTAYLDS